MELHRNEDKNILLKRTRGISFEDIQICIDEDKMIKIINHPNVEQYSNQRILLANHKDYIYVVPFVIQENGSLFLKTIYPSRDYTKFYLSL